MSALTRLPPAARESRGSSGKPFSASSWGRPEGEPGARSNRSWGVFCLEWRRGKLRGEEPESFGDREVTSGCHSSKDAEGSVLGATGTGTPDCISDGGDLHGPCGAFGRDGYWQLLGVSCWGSGLRGQPLLVMLGSWRAGSPAASPAGAAVSGLVTAWLISRES